MDFGAREGVSQKPRVSPSHIILQRNLVRRSEGVGWVFVVVFACLFVSQMGLTGASFPLLGAGEMRGERCERGDLMGNFSGRQEGTAALHRRRCRVRGLDPVMEERMVFLS